MFPESVTSKEINDQDHTYGAREQARKETLPFGKVAKRRVATGVSSAMNVKMGIVSFCITGVLR